jgi:PAS domain S-box-containing protein
LGDSDAIMIKVLTCITQQHDIRLVLVAILVCGVACFAALTLSARGAGERLRVTWLLAGALAFGCGTWAAHFISMLAFTPHLPIGYDFGETATSVVVASVGAVFGLALFLKRRRRWTDPILAGTVFGGSVGIMHFVGMAAVRVPGVIFYDPAYVVASLMVGSVLFAVAFLVVTRIESLGQRLAGAALLALAICALHFTAMTAVSILPDPAVAMPPNLIANHHLGVMVAVVCLMVLGFGLVAAHFDQRMALHGAKELAQFRQLADATFSGVFVYRDGVILDVNAALCGFMGCQAADLIGHPVTEFVGPESYERIASRIVTGRLEAEEFDVVVKSGELRTVEVISRVIEYRGGDARVTALRDITDRKRESVLLAAERRILTGIAENRPLSETLAEACAAAEAVLPASLCSILLVSDDGKSLRSLAAPHLPPAYSAAINGGLIGPAAGSCGTAAYRRQPVIVEDIASDPLWADYKDLALGHGLQACWSARPAGCLGPSPPTIRARTFRPAMTAK